MTIKTWQETVLPAYHGMPNIVLKYAQKKIDELRAALAETKQVLEEFDVLIKHQYTSTREAMSDLTYAAQHCAAVLKMETP